MERITRNRIIGISIILGFITVAIFLVFIPGILRNFLDTDDTIYQILIHGYLSLQVMFYFTVLSIFFLDLNFFDIFKNKNQNFHEWMTSLHTNDSFSTLVYTLAKNTKTEVDDMDYLKKLKNEIILYCGFRRDKLYLFRGYYSSKLNNNNKLIWFSIISPLILTIAFAIREKLLGNEVIVHGTEFSIAYTLIFSIVAIIFIYTSIIKTFKAYSIIYNVTDAIIQDIEGRENNGKKIRLVSYYDGR